MPKLREKSFARFKVLLVIVILFGIGNIESTTTPSMNLLPKPSFAEPIPNVTVSAGRDVSLPCVIENLGSYRVAWSHKDKNTLISIQTRVIMRNTKYSVTQNNNKVWYLHFRKVDANDSGHYMCQINTTPMISQIGYLDVVVAPSIIEDETSSDTGVREGNDVSFKCSASGSPMPSIKWRREDENEILTEDGKVHDLSGVYLNLTKVSRLSMGAYLCIASNGIPPSVSKRIMLNVKFPPMIWIPNQLVGVALGNDIALDCHLESHPEPVTYWTKGPNHIVVLSSENRDSLVMRSGMYKIQMRLRIRNVTPEDYGAYTCVAKNSLGETEGKIRLYEISATSTKPVYLYGSRDSKNAVNQEEQSLQSSEYDTLPPVSSNNLNYENLNTAWRNPTHTQKGSIETGDRNRAENLPTSSFLYLILRTIVYVCGW